MISSTTFTMSFPPQILRTRSIAHCADHGIIHRRGPSHQAVGAMMTAESLSVWRPNSVAAVLKFIATRCALMASTKDRRARKYAPSMSGGKSDVSFPVAVSPPVLGWPQIRAVESELRPFGRVASYCCPSSLDQKGWSGATLAAFSICHRKRYRGNITAKSYAAARAEPQ